MKKGDCVLCKHEIPRSDSTTAHSDQGFHCLSMHFTVTSVFLGTQLKMPICLLGFLDHCRNGRVDVHLMFGSLCFYCMGYRSNYNLAQWPEASGSQLYDAK